MRWHRVVAGELYGLNALWKLNLLFLQDALSQSGARQIRHPGRSTASKRLLEGVLILGLLLQLVLDQLEESLIPLSLLLLILLCKLGDNDCSPLLKLLRLKLHLLQLKQLLLLGYQFSLLAKCFGLSKEFLDLLNMQTGRFVCVQLGFHVDTVVCAQVELTNVVVVAKFCAVVHK